MPAREQTCTAKNRVRELRSPGTVRDEGSNVLVYSDRSDISNSLLSRARQRRRKSYGAHPEVELARRIHIVFAHEVELAIYGNTENGQPRWYVDDVLTIADQKSFYARCDQNAPTGVYSERARMHSASVNMLDQARLPRVRVDRIHSDIVFPALKNLLSIPIRESVRAIRDIDVITIWVHVNST
jgi:hypothetical protein